MDVAKAMLHLHCNNVSLNIQGTGGCATLGPKDSQRPAGKLWHRGQGCDLQGGCDQNAVAAQCCSQNVVAVPAPGTLSMLMLPDQGMSK
eukprot:320271-Pelagomonas_calceolata.AAC.1